MSELQCEEPLKNESYAENSSSSKGEFMSEFCGKDFCAIEVGKEIYNKSLYFYGFLMKNNQLPLVAGLHRLFSVML